MGLPIRVISWGFFGRDAGGLYRGPDYTPGGFAAGREWRVADLSGS